MSGVYDHEPGAHQTAHDGTVVAGPNGHTGWDWVLPKGAPVLAAMDGVVAFSGVEPAFTCPLTGKVVRNQQVIKLRHNHGEQRLQTAYAHLSEREVVVGTRVRAGQRIGAVGASGCASGPHLHFSVWQSSSGPMSPLVSVDPFKASLWDREVAGISALADSARVP